MKENLKYLIIGVAMIISGGIIASTIQNLSASVRLGTQTNQSIGVDMMSKTGWESNTYEQNLDANQFLTYSVAEQNKVLKVWKNNVLSEYSGKDLKAVYYHVGQVLLISYLDENSKSQFHYFHQPDKWE